MKLSDKEMEKVEDLFSLGKFSETLMFLNDNIGEETRNCDISRWKGNCFLQTNEFALAEKNYRLALKINSSCFKCVTNLGIIEFKRKNYKQALSYFENSFLIVHENSKLPDYLLILSLLRENVGDCYLMMKKYRSAFFEYYQSFHLNPLKAKILNKLVESNCMWEEGDETVSLWMEAEIKWKSNSIRMLCDKDILLRFAKYQAISNCDINRRALEELGVGNPRKCLEEYENSLGNISSIDYVICMNMGVCYLQLGEMRKSFECSSLSIMLNPKCVDVIANRLISLLRSGRFVLVYALEDIGKLEVLDAVRALKPLSFLIENEKDDNIRSDFFNRRAGVYRSLNRFKEALGDYNESIALRNTPHYSCYLSRGSLYFHKEDYRSAIRDYSKLVEIDPLNFKYRSLIGDCYFRWGSTQEPVKSGYIEKAVREYTLAIKIAKSENLLVSDNHKLAETFSLRGLCYEILEMLEKAIEDYTILVNSLPKENKFYVDARKGKRIIETRLKIREINHMLSGMIQQEPEKLEHYYERGRNYFDLGDFELSASDLLRCVDLETLTPKIENLAVDTFLFLGNCFHQLNRAKDGIKVLSRFVESQSSDHTSNVNQNVIITNAYITRGLCYTSENEIEKAINDFSKAIEISPTYSLPYFRRSCMYSWIPSKTFFDVLGNREQSSLRPRNLLFALKDINRAIELDPSTNLDYHNQRGNVLVALERIELGIEDYSKVLIVSPRDKFVLSNRGIAFSELGRYKESEQDFLNSLAEDKDYVLALLGIGRLYKKIKRFNEAFKYLRKARDLQPENETIYEELYRTLVFCSDAERAMDAYWMLEMVRFIKNMKFGFTHSTRSYNLYNFQLYEMFKEGKLNEKYGFFERDTMKNVNLEQLYNRQIRQILLKVDSTRSVCIVDCEIVKFLGSGAFASAYLCFFNFLPGLFVLKEYHPGHVLSGRREKLLLRDSVSIPDHRNVVGVFSSRHFCRKGFKKKNFNSKTEEQRFVDLAKNICFTCPESMAEKDRYNPASIKLRRKQTRKLEHHDGKKFVWWNSRSYLFMKYRHRTLTKFVEGRKKLLTHLQPLEICRMLVGILRGVVHLFDNNVVHRDLRPDNILLDELEGRILVGDLGCCLDFRDCDEQQGWLIDRTSKLLKIAKESFLAGYFMYVPPEIHSEEGVYIDFEKCDIFSVGMVGYYLITAFLTEKEDAFLFPFNKNENILQYQVVKDDWYANCDQGDYIDLGRLWNGPKEISDLIKEMLMLQSSERIGCREALEVANDILMRMGR